MGRTNAKVIPTFFEVRVRNSGHAGSIFGVQVEANNAKHAKKRVNGRVISIRKIKPVDLLGNIEHIDISRTQPPQPKIKDTYSEDWTLGEALFDKK